MIGPLSRSVSLWVLLLHFASFATLAGDWPAWRYDAQRSAASPHKLPPNLRLAWSRELPRLKPAWPDQPKMQFDAVYEPIVVGQRLFIGSPHDGSVTAYETRTGNEAWRFYSDGPVRFAPLAWEGKLYLVSDDGYLYCLKADDGALAWKFRGGPSDRKILGNERLISTWPARGAPVIADGKVYFAAGIWPFMGIFLHALDATTGQVLWTNDGDGSRYMKQPHNTDSFASVAPQGPLVVVGNKLLVPGGRSVPACFDRQTGKLMYYQLAENSKKGGGSSVAATDKLLFNGGAIFDLDNEKHLSGTGEHLAIAEGRLYEATGKKIRALDLTTAAIKSVESLDRKGVKTTTTKWTADELGSVESGSATALIKAGDRLYVGRTDGLAAWSLPLMKDGKTAPAWEVTLKGTPASLVAADDRLFAVTKEGMLYCFAADAPLDPGTHELSFVADSNSADTRAILKAARVRDGYCLVFGAESAALPMELAERSELRITVIEENPDVVTKLRAAARAASLGGDQLAVIAADPKQVSLPPYLASLIVVQALPETAEMRTEFIGKVFECLRPFGGVAVLPVPADEIDSLAASVERLDLENASCKPAGRLTLLVREGPLPDSANWSGEHADAANTRVSKDKLVKAPLGLLWFGGSSNESILPRHGHGPQPQVVDGRVFIEGMDSLRAMDIYTGRVLWEAKLPGVGALYDNTAHQPGANASGTNFIATPEGVYVAVARSCFKLDPATGKRLSQFQLPASPEAKSPPLWGYLNVDGDYLIGGGEPIFDKSLVKNSSKQKQPPINDDDDKKAAEKEKQSALAKAAEAVAKVVLKVDNDNYSASGRLVVMERESGKVRWTATAKSGFRHNAICLGGGRMYCIDRLSGAQLSKLKRRGEEPPHKPRLVVFDLATGREVWSTEEDVFGTWLSYSAERDVLIEAGRKASDTLSDEPKGMRAYRAANGSELWSNKNFSGPAMIHHDTILMAGSACQLLTGAPKMREHPLTGEPVEWTWSRNYGCNTPAASEHLLTFRSGAAGYLDFCNDGGTGNFGGFRSSCTNNLIVAGGVLSAPDYTRTCSCSYQNQTSLALVHMPDAEIWTSFGSQSFKKVVRRVGLNLGAPGDRKAEDGTLWLEYPSVGGSSPALEVKIEPEKPEWFRRHSSQFTGPAPAWVASSGAKGLTSLRFKLGGKDDPPRRYTVRLLFAEPDDVAAGERVFAVRLQGKQLRDALDIVKEAGGRNRSLVKEFAGVEVKEELVLELVPDAAANVQAAVLSGIEIQAEGW